MAEIVKHFKILVKNFSARLSWHTGVLTKAVTFEIVATERWGIREHCVCVCVLCGTVYLVGVHYRDSVWISP